MLRQRHAGLVQRLPEGGHERVEVGAGGDLGDHAAEADVFVHGGGHGVGQQGGPPDDPDAGLVAGGLDAEDQRLACWVRFMGGLLPWAARSVVRGVQPEPHDEGVDAVAVVAATDMDLFEPEAAVELLGPGVVRPDLQQNVLGVAPPAFPDELGEQGRADAHALVFGHDGDGLDVRDRLDAHQPGVAHDPAVEFRDEVAAGLGLGQFVEEHLQRPRVHREEPALQLMDGRDVRCRHVPQRHRRPAAWTARPPGSQRTLPGAGHLGVGLPQVQRGGVQQPLPAVSRARANWPSESASGCRSLNPGTALTTSGVYPGPGTVDRQVREVRGESHVRAVQQLRQLAVGERIAGPVDFLAARIGGDDELWRPPRWIQPLRGRSRPGS